MRSRLIPGRLHGVLADGEAHVAGDGTLLPHCGRGIEAKEGDEVVAAVVRVVDIIAG